MGITGFFYRSGIALSCVCLMLASVACTGWFFYTWLQGIPGLVGAAVGCSIQIMAYGFSGMVVNQVTGLLRPVLMVLIASALSLSVLSSYATLTGYFMALQNDREAKQQVISQKQAAISAALEQRLRLMESMSRDVAIASEAADQGLAEKYRTQAGSFLSKNAEARVEIEQQIEKLEAIAQSELLSLPAAEEGTPIGGLASVFGGQRVAIIVLCAWLAIMFDALPIAGIMLLETRGKGLAVTAHAAAAMEGPLLPRKVYASELLQDHLQLVDDAHLTDTPLLAGKGVIDEEQRVLTNIGSSAPELTKAFFIGLLGFKVKFESDWYIQLCTSANPDADFGILAHDSELIPDDYRGAPQSVYLTIPVPDVDSIYHAAKDLDVEIVQAPKNEFYGQRRMLVREPGGCLVDICSPWEGS